MRFDLNEDQRLLKDTARLFLAERYPLDEARRALEDPKAQPPDSLWKEIVEMGWTGLPFPEEFGGVALDLPTLAALAEETGRALLPGPLLSTLLAGLIVDRHAGEAARKRWITEICGGSARLSLAIDEPASAWGVKGVKLAAGKGDGGEGFVLNGTKILVPDAVDAAAFVVAARLEGEPALFLVPAEASGITVNPMTRIDGQKIAEIVFDSVAVGKEASIVAPGKASADALEDGLALGALVLAAEMTGGAERVLEMTADYAQARVQFGRPIGSFQAVSHRLADMLVEVEVGRALLYGAALALEEDPARGRALASAAKAWTSNTYPGIAESGVQLHGGIGYTWEHDVHLFLRRARALAPSFGDADDHRGAIARYLEAGLGKSQALEKEVPK